MILSYFYFLNAAYCSTILNPYFSLFISLLVNVKIITLLSIFFFIRALANLNFVTKQKLATKDDLSYCLNEIFEGISAFSSSLDVYSNDRKLEPMMKAITILYHRTMELRMLSGYSLEKKLFTNQKFRFTCEKSLQFWGDQLPTR